MKLALIFFFASFLFLGVAGKASAATYYVDATGGDDSNDGTSTVTAWQTISKINASSFSPGDFILFKKGNTWREQLTVASSGSAGNPITFGAYGSGTNPKIYKTNTFSAWWENGSLADQSFESFVAGSPTDNWSTWGETVSGAGTVHADTDAKTGIYSAKLTADCNGTLFPSQCANVHQTISGIQNNTAYYFSAWGMVHQSGNNSLVIRIKDTGNNKYLDGSGVWQTSSSTVAASWNGAAVNTWVEKTMVINSAASLSASYEIKFYNFQTGSSLVDNVYFNQGTESGAVKIWGGTLGSTYDYYYHGAILNGSRVPRYTYNQNQPILSTAEGYFNNQGFFYYRNDAGNPGAMEIGARANAIYIKGKSYIVVDGIDAYGPGADKNSSTVDCAAFGSYICRTASILIENGSSDITIKNNEISQCNGFGLFASSTTSNVYYDNVSIHDCEDTGAYINANGGSVTNSRVYNNARLITDTATAADRGGIGSFQGANLTISGNEVYQNASDNATGDYEISIVAPSTAFTVTKNYVHDCVQGCIQIAEGGNNSVISNNIISTYGTTTADPSSVSDGSFGGIRIGGGAGGATGVTVYNNIIYGGAQSTSVGHAGLTIPNLDSSGLTVKNNIFLNNTNKDIYVKSGATTTSDDFGNNIFYKPDYTNNWNWKGTNYSTLASWQSNSALDATSLTSNPLFANTSGNYSQISDFQPQFISSAIDSGTDVSLTSDYAGNPIYGAPDIGAYEYQPPHTMGTDEISTSATVRVYGDEKFRNKAAPSGANTADLTITLPNIDRTQWLDTEITTWNISGTFGKTWTESSTASGLTNITHTIGDLEASKYYNVSVDSVVGQNITGADCTSGVCTSNAQGKITFTYTGTYSTHTFSVAEGDNTAPTTTASVAAGLYSTTQSVTLTCDDGSGVGCAATYYTTDGTTPTTSSTQYTGAISIAATTITLKFFSQDSNLNAESVNTNTYTIDTTNFNPIKINIGRSVATFDDTVYFHKNIFKLKGSGESLANGTVKIYRDGKRIETFDIGSDGEWSKKLRLKDNFSGWLKVKQFDQDGALLETKKVKIKVDTEKPAFTALFSSGMSRDRKQKISFAATDPDSGIDYYRVKLAGIREWRRQNEDFYFIPADTPSGIYTLFIRVYDKAGNYAEEKTVLSIPQYSHSVNLASVSLDLGNNPVSKGVNQEAPNRKNEDADSTGNDSEIPAANQDPEPKNSSPAGGLKWWNPFSWF